MALKGFTRDVLIQILDDLAIKELATTTQRWECGTVVEKDTSIFRIGLKTRISNFNKCWEKLYEYHAYSREGGEAGEGSRGYESSIKILKKLLNDFTKATKDFQKDVYAKEHNIYNSHSIIEFPLDKKPGLNALYDDFSATFLFFDDISTLGNNKAALLRAIGKDSNKLNYFCNCFNVPEDVKGNLFKLTDGDARADYWVGKYGPDRVDYFETLSTEERIDYVTDNIEFDHCILGGTLNPNWAINVYGEVEESLSAFKSGSSQHVLPAEFSDFTKVRLVDTLKIKNQDLMQVMQSKIDIDRENLEVCDVRYIGGDEYKLVKIPEEMLRGSDKTNPYLIRFICPSTDRTYHVDIDTNMLSNSSHYMRDDEKTYIKSWWHITHGGVDPDKVKRVIRT